MPVTTPPSGNVIVKPAIVGMHDDVLDLANAAALEQLARAGLSFNELPSTIVLCDSVRVSTNTQIDATTAEFTTEDITAVIADWQDVTDAILDNGGAGYVFDEPGVLVYMATIRVSQWHAAGGGPAVALTAIVDENQQAWMAVTYSFDGVESGQMIDAGFVFGQIGYVDEEEVITVVGCLPPVAWSGEVLDFIKIKACSGKGVGGVPRDFMIASAALTFALFRVNL